MNISQLMEVLDEALERGIDPECEVVLDVQAMKNCYDWAILSKVHDPSADSDWLWFTLVPGEEADSRFTPGHVNDD
jgi:hypothetical protein